MLDSSRAHGVKPVKGNVKTLPSVAKGTEQQPGPDSWDQIAVKHLTELNCGCWDPYYAPTVVWCA
jgi:hypothetical protein